MLFYLLCLSIYYLSHLLPHQAVETFAASGNLTSAPHPVPRWSEADLTLPLAPTPARTEAPQLVAWPNNPTRDRYLLYYDCFMQVL